MSTDRGWAAIDSFLADLALMPDEFPIGERPRLLRALERVARQAEMQGPESRAIAHALLLKLYQSRSRMGEEVEAGLSVISERKAAA